MTTLTNPPGFRVNFTEPVARRFEDPAVYNLFAVGFSDRGSVEQGAGVADLLGKIGARQNYSVDVDALVAAIVEAEGATWTFSRVTGPNPVKATATVTGPASAASITIKAKDYGSYGNGATGGFSFDITTPASGQRKVVVKFDGDPVVTVTGTTTAELAAITDENDYVDIILDGTTLPSNTGSTTNLAGGDDDRANATADDWAAALANLDPRFGPGTLLAPGVDDDEVRALIAAHCDATNRVPLLDLSATITQSDALTAAASLRSDAPDTAKHVGLWDSWAYCTPISSDPERLVPYSAIQAGICSRVHRTSGICTPAFGPDAASSRIAARLYREYTDDERAALYAAGINVATDDGATIASWGFTTADLSPLHVDLHQQYVRMGLRFDGEQVLKAFIGKQIDPVTKASLHGRLDSVLKAYVEARGLYDYAIDVDSVNTDDTAAARQLYAGLSIKHTKTADWVELNIGISA